MRFGAQIFETYRTPEEFLSIVRRKRLRAVYNPVLHPEDAGEVREYADICRENDIVIAEVGAWGHSFVSRSPSKREEAFRVAARQLALADKLCARTCVNVSGSPGDRWDGPHPDNYSDETFALVVRTVRRLLDTVCPQNTTFSLEPMPWMIPDSLESYQRLLDAVARERFSVHYDPVNIIASPRSYFLQSEEMTRFIRTLGGKICSVHMKDVHMQADFNAVILEKQPGQGELDYATLLAELNLLDADLPVMTEHMHTEEESLRAEAYIRGIARSHSIPL